MRRMTPHATLALAAALLVAGCGTQTGSAPSGSTVPSSSASPSASKSSDCPSEVTLNADDNGRTVCVTSGGKITVALDGTTSRPWAVVKTTGQALEATNAGVRLKPGDAASAFRAVAAGKAVLTSSRPLCAQTPGKISCKGLQLWTVKVTVRD